MALDGCLFSIILKVSPLGPSIMYVTLFWSNFDPLSPCHTFSHILDPQFLVVHAFMHMSEAAKVLTGVLSGFFIWKVLFGVVFVRHPSVGIHPLQQKVKHHFQF